jgi:RND superfamily putative drug exporter
VSRRHGRRSDGILHRLGLVFATRAGWVLATAASVAVVAVLWGAGVFASLSPGGFEDPASGSAQAQRIVDERFPGAEPDLILLYSSSRGTVDERAFRHPVQSQLAALDERSVLSTASYWSTGSTAMVSRDRRATFVLVTLRGSGDEEKAAAYERVRDQLTPPAEELRLQVGGDVAVFADVTAQSEKDIRRAEMVSMPVVLVLLVLVFGSLVGAVLPLLVGAMAILGALTVLRVLTTVTDVSVFAVNIIVMLGLGLSIDYALLVVTRFREEIAGSRDRADVGPAVARTLATAGRTVAFSGLTVAISLASLLLFPQPFLRSMGLGGIAAILVAVTTSLTLLPALMGVLGHRVDAVRLVPARPEPRHRRERLGAWHRLALKVMHRPLTTGVLVVSALLLSGAPFLGVVFGSPGHRALPESFESRVVAERLSAEFASEGALPIEVVVRGEGGSALEASALRRYEQQLGAVPDVTEVRVQDSARDAVRIFVQTDHGEQSPEARRVVDAVRAVPAPAGADVLVGGPAAQLDDMLASLSGTAPTMVAVMALVTLVLLFVAFGSVVLPIKAVVLNVLSLSASFGLLVVVFQEGRLASALGVSATGSVDPTTLLLVMAVIFGLSMDYEVFLLSRIREEWQRTGDNTYSVAAGLQHTGRIITSAAGLFVVVIGAFSTSDVLFIKMLGLGMVAAVVIDATLVRILLVPATMQLMGRLNWWMPKPLERLWERRVHG